MVLHARERERAVARERGEDAAADGDLAGVGFGGLGGFSGGGGGGGNRGDGDGRRDRSDDRGDKRVYRGKALTQRIKQLGDRRRLDEVLALAAASPIPTTTNGRRITVGAVIGACCKCGDLERGMRLLRQLDGPDGCGAGAPAYCALIQAHGRAGRLREALELLEAWEKGRGPRDGKIGVGRNGTIYVAGSLKWRKKDVPLRGEKWRDEMGVTWHAPRVAQSRMLLTVLDACASCGDVARARFFKTKLLAWDGRVVDGRVAFDGVSDAEAAWNAVAKAHANSDDPLTALPVLREMETDPSDPVAPTQVSYNIALKACQRGGRPDWARALIARMRAVAARTGDADMYPDAVSYTTAARAEAAAARGFAGDQHAGGVQAVDAMYAEVRGPLGPPPTRSATPPSSTPSWRTARWRARSPRWPPPSANRAWTSPRARTSASCARSQPRETCAVSPRSPRASRRSSPAARLDGGGDRAALPRLAPSQVPGPWGPRPTRPPPPPPPRWAAICAAPSAPWARPWRRRL